MEDYRKRRAIVYMFKFGFDGQSMTSRRRRSLENGKNPGLVGLGSFGVALFK